MHNFSSIIRILLSTITIILLSLPFARTQEIHEIHKHNEHEIVDITALIFGHVDLIACSFVIYSAFMKWRTSNLSISSRVPLYFSIADVCQFPVFMSNFYYSLVNHHKPIPDQTCKVLAYLLILQININMVLMASIALVTYLRVVKSKTINLGKYDWKFFLWVVLLSSFLSTPSIPSLGPSKFWCLTTASTSKPANTLLINAYAIFAITFLTTCYCYFKTLSTIFSVNQEERSDSADRIRRRNRLERRATRKILIYVFIFAKWIPLLLYGVVIMFNYDEALWIDLAMIIAFNLGGAGNCILYFLNEYSSHDPVTYNLDIEGGQEVDNPSSHQLTQSFQQNQQTNNSSTNSVTLVVSTLEESVDVIDLKSFDAENKDIKDNKK